MADRIIGPDELYFTLQVEKRLPIYWKDLKISQNFWWSEAFEHCTDEEIINASEKVFHSIKRHAETMQKVRAVFGRPVIIHSWYRSPERNAAVGGVPNSRHLKGDACDFHIQGMETVKQNLSVQKKLDAQGFMQKCGLEYTNGKWTHVDSRGYKARFYG